MFTFSIESGSKGIFSYIVIKREGYTTYRIPIVGRRRQEGVYDIREYSQLLTVLEQVLNSMEKSDG